MEPCRRRFNMELLGRLKRPDVYYMPRIGTGISGFFAAVAGQGDRARVSDL